MHEYDFAGRTARRHCAEILQHLGFRRLNRVDREEVTSWIAGELCPTGHRLAPCSSRFFCGAGTVAYTARVLSH
ncbi:hypothetical protein [Rhizobium ruizarguesonis]|uniref:hypothetical protein n=1 Tax=Rhizobium ruizarguesonis TaxID=2081791 RepID=UPI00371088BE